MLDVGSNAQLIGGLVVAAAGTLLGLAAQWVAASPQHLFVRFCALSAVLSLGLPIGAYDLILTVFFGAGQVFLAIHGRRHIGGCR